MTGDVRAPRGADDAAAGRTERSAVARLWARGLGAVQEAERTGSWRIGTEHLLVACLLDPVARQWTNGTSLDMRAVQVHIGRPVHAGIRAVDGLLPTTGQMYLSDGAERCLAQLRDRAVSDGAFVDWVHDDASTDPRGRSAMRRRLLADLVRDTEDGASRRVLDGLGLDPGTRSTLVGRLSEIDTATSVRDRSVVPYL